MTNYDRNGRVHPNDLVAALQAAGWTDAGSRPGMYVRLRWPITPDGRPHSTLIPLDQEAGDYGFLLDAALAELGVLARLGTLADQVLTAVLSTYDPSSEGAHTDGPRS